MSATLLAASRWRTARWLVIAPHADDETLGAGALIAEAGAEGRLAGIAFLTDGTGSHGHTGHASRARLKAMRRTEAGAACRILSGASPLPIFLDWTDARPRQAGSIAYRDTVSRLTSLCRRERVDAIAVTGSTEPHCDHAAAANLAYAIAGAALRPVAVFEYFVWGEPPAQARPFVTRPMTPGRRRAALAAHRSQLTPVFGEGFRLSPDRQAMPDRDRLYLRSPHAAS